jgi:GT2 family glycosyltransferase
MIKIVAVILNYNSSKDCEKCIKYLVQQDYENLQILVVDNNSTYKDEINFLSKICNQYKAELVLSTDNKGFSAGNNIGLKRAVELGADWCLIINPDVEIRDKCYVSYMSQQFEKWPLSVVSASNVILPDGSRQNPQRELGFWEEFLWPIQSLRAKFSENFNWYVMPDNTGYCEKLCGCCFFIKCDFLLDIGFLDENVFMYSEEAILSKKVLHVGGKELYIKEATAYHEHYSLAKECSYSRMLKQINSRNYFIKQYSGFKTIKKTLLIISNKAAFVFWKLKEKQVKIKK